MLGRNKRIKSNNQPRQTLSRTWSTILSKWKLAVLGLVFIPTAIISTTNLVTPTAYAAVTIDECVALNDKGRDAGSITKETYENSGVCNIMKRYTNLDKDQVKADCSSKYGGQWSEFLGGWACNLITLTDGVSSRNGTRTIDPSIQTEAECKSVNGIWTADGNFEGPGEMGTCQVTVGASVDGSEEEGEELSCQIEGIGWMVCPIFNAIGSLTDASYEVVERLLLTPTSMFNTGTDSNSALNTAWSIVRNVANVAFVIAFLLIIYSQLTGRGIGNYGIKKMLPRLIISAILVNASFIVSAIAVDISNIVGSSVSGLFSNLSSSIDASVGDLPWKSEGNIWGALVTLVISGGATALIVGGAAASGTIWLGIATLAPILVAAFFAVLTVVIVLVLRQALIVLLIVVAPLAFVAFLLPNTEGLFRKWMKLFIVLLAMFPSIALIFSVSKLAGAIVMASSTDMLVQIAGAGMTIIPLFITPVVMKTAGGTLNRLTGTLNVGAGKGLTARAKRMRGDAWQRVSAEKRARSIGRGERIIGSNSGSKWLGSSGSKRRRAIGSVASLGATSSVHMAESLRNAKSAEQDATQDYLANQLGDENNKLANVLSANDEQVQSIRARATAAVDKQEDSEVAEREILMRATFKDPRKTVQDAAAALSTAIENNDIVGAKAAQNILLGSGTFGVTKLRETLAESEDNGNLASDSETSAALRRDLAKAGLKGKDNALNTWAIKNAGSLSEVAQSADTYSGLSDAELIGQSPANLRSAQEKNAISAEHAAEMLNNPSLAGNFTKEKREIFKAIANGQSVQISEENPKSNPQDKLTNSAARKTTDNFTDDGRLTIDHNKSLSTNAANQSVSAKQAAPAGAQVPQPAFNPNQNQQSAGQPSGWTQTDSGLSIPRSAAPQAPQPTPQPAPTVVPQAPVQQTPTAPPQAAPAQPAQPQKINVEVDTSGLKKDFKDAVSDLAYESRLKSSRVSDRAAALAEEKRRKRPGDDL